MRGSLRLRLLLSLAVILLCGTLVQGLFAYRGARAAADDQFDYQMQQLAISIAQGISAIPDPRSPTLAADIRNFDFIVQVWTIGGVRVFATEPRVLISLETPDGLADWSGQDGYYRIVTLREPGRVIQVAQDQAIRSRLAGQFAWRAIMPGALWAPLVLLVGLWLVDRALRPLRRVREQVAERRADDLSPIDDSALPDEIRPVISEFNGLLARLKSAFDTQGRFVADAAHELRTPLTALRLQIQSLARQIDGRAADDGIRLAVGRVSDGLDRATRLVDQLLTLAREDHRRQSGGVDEPDATTSVALDAIAREAIEALSDLAVARDIDLGLAATEPVRVIGDRHALGMLARNLDDHAIKYTPRGGTVDVRVQHVDGRGRLTVEDSGPGVPPSELPQLFDRFHRGTAPDAEDRPTGSGLGLAIVQAIAARHRATLDADASPGLGGLRIRVELAASNAATATAAPPDPSVPSIASASSAASKASAPSRPSAPPTPPAPPAPPAPSASPT